MGAEIAHVQFVICMPAIAVKEPHRVRLPEKQCIEAAVLESEVNAIRELLNGTDARIVPQIGYHRGQH